MAFNVVQVGTTVTSNGASTTTLQVTLPNPVTAGNSLLIFAPSYNTSATQLVTASGFVASSFASADGATSGNILVQAVAAGGATTITLTVGSYSYTRATMLEVSGLSTSPVDVSFGATGSSTSLTATATSNTSSANEVIVGLMWIGASASWPTQTNFTNLYIDNNSGPASMGAFEPITGIQKPTATWNNNTGSTVGLLFVTLKLTGGPLPVTSSTNGSFKIKGGLSTLSQATATLKGQTLVSAHLLRAGFFNGVSISRMLGFSRMANAYFTNTSIEQGASSSRGYFVNQNQVCVVGSKTLYNRGNGWSSSTVSAYCPPGSSLFVVTTNNQGNLSGTYKPTVNNGLLQTIYDQESAAIGTVTPQYVQVFAVINSPGLTYTVTPPSEGANGTGTMTVFCVANVLGVRPNSITSYYNVGSNLGFSAASGSGTIKNDFVISAVLGYAAPNVLTSSLQQSIDIDPIMGMSISSQLASANGAVTNSVYGSRTSSVQAAVSFALIPTIGGVVSATLQSKSVILGTAIPAVPLYSRSIGSRQLTGNLAFQLPFSAAIKATSKLAPNVLLNQYVSAIIKEYGTLLAATSQKIGTNARLVSGYKSASTLNYGVKSAAISSIASKTSVAQGLKTITKGSTNIQSFARQGFTNSTIGNLGTTALVGLKFNATFLSAYTLTTELSSRTVSMSKSATGSLAKYGVSVSGKNYSVTSLQTNARNLNTSRNSSTHSLKSLIQYGVNALVPSKTMASSSFLSALKSSSYKRTILQGTNLLNLYSQAKTNARTLQVSNVRQLAYLEATTFSVTVATAHGQFKIPATSVSSKSSKVTAYVAQTITGNSSTRGANRLQALYGVLKNSTSPSSRLSYSVGAIKITEQSFAKSATHGFSTFYGKGLFNSSAYTFRSLTVTPSVGINATSTSKERSHSANSIQLMQYISSVSKAQLMVSGNSVPRVILKALSVAQTGLSASLSSRVASTSNSRSRLVGANTVGWNPTSNAAMVSRSQSYLSVRTFFTSFSASSSQNNSTTNLIVPWSNLVPTDFFVVDIEPRIFLVEIDFEDN